MRVLSFPTKNVTTQSTMILQSSIASVFPVLGRLRRILMHPYSLWYYDGWYPAYTWDEGYCTRFCSFRRRHTSLSPQTDIGNASFLQICRRILVSKLKLRHTTHILISAYHTYSDFPNTVRGYGDYVFDFAGIHQAHSKNRTFFPTPRR